MTNIDRLDQWKMEGASSEDREAEVIYRSQGGVWTFEVTLKGRWPNGLRFKVHEVMQCSVGSRPLSALTSLVELMLSQFATRLANPEKARDESE